MESTTITAKIIDSEIVYKQSDKLIKLIAEVGDGKEIYIKFKKIRPFRTIQQNKYLHGVVFKRIADYTGHSMEKIKIAMKAKFLSKKIMKGRLGKTLDIIGNTSDLNTVELAEFIDRIRKWAWDFAEIRIPLPEDKEG